MAAVIGSGVAYASSGTSAAGATEPPLVVENLSAGRPLTRGGTQVWRFDLVNDTETARTLDRSASRVLVPKGWSFDARDPRLPACTRRDLIVGVPTWPVRLAPHERRTVKVEVTLKLTPQGNQYNCTGASVPLTIVAG
jgi:hypothetical protein